MLNVINYQLTNIKCGGYHASNCPCKGQSTNPFSSAKLTI